MRCWRMNQLGDPWALLKMEEHDLPTADRNQIKISVETADLNFADILQCQGRYQVKLDPPLHSRYDRGGEDHSMLTQF